MSRVRAQVQVRVRVPVLLLVINTVGPGNYRPDALENRPDALEVLVVRRLLVLPVLPLHYPDSIYVTFVEDYVPLT